MPLFVAAGFILLGATAGVVAALVGFGIGSLLTPALAVFVGTKLAVAAVAIPHATGSAIRLWLLRAHIDRTVLLTFGLTSAVGGLAGALLQTFVGGKALAVVFGLVLVAAGVSELSGWVRKRRWTRSAALAAGVASGFLGGLVGNQGGIRAAAMLGFDVPRQSFVATATAAGLIVDAARLPVYIASLGSEMLAIWPVVAAMTAGVVAGTLFGVVALGHLPDAAFRRLVGILLIALGTFTALFVE